MPISTIVFDAYGTLFDVAGAARLAATEPDQSALAAVWPRLAEDWRRKQLEYTWLRTIMGCHADFASVTADALDRLAARGATLAILSNGTPAMLEAATRAAGIGTRFAALLSVEGVGVYKPHTSVYGMVARHLGARADEVLFVSSNGWDVAGAAGFGFTPVWINRNRLPVDRLPFAPHHIAPDLSTLPDIPGLP
jgi:2-haloacid dehalogenase